jgi:cysteine desulfurase / selenocysteine lyase
MMPRDYTKDFSLKPQYTWLNVASEGPLPKAAAEALQEAIKWKESPHLLTTAKFQQVPAALKKTIARLINVDGQDVILGNSATYGLHLMSHGIKFIAGDEIILLQNDFPTDILPWLSLEQKGVIVHQLKARQQVLTPQELEQAINRRTKLICLPLIHSFTGFKQDIKTIGQLCLSRGILCVVNLSQAAGAFEIDLSQWDVDAVVCAGYKWLLGPYGTGFCWIKKEVRQQLEYAQNYWIALMDEEALNTEGVINLKDDHSARRYDVFGTANFFNYVPWQASIEYLLSIRLDNVDKHNQMLVDQIVNGLNQKHFDLLSPRPKSERTNIVVFSHKDASQNPRLFGFLKSKGFYLALWKNKLRVSPHIYNTSREMEGLLTALDQYASRHRNIGQN